MPGAGEKSDLKEQPALAEALSSKEIHEKARMVALSTQQQKDLRLVADRGRQMLEDRKAAREEAPDLEDIEKPRESSQPQQDLSSFATPERFMTDGSAVDTLPLYSPVHSHEAPITRRDVIEEVLEPSSTASTKKEGASIYHIYHTGTKHLSFSIHWTPDSAIPLPQIDDPNAPNYVEDEKLQNYQPAAMKRWFKFGKSTSVVKGHRCVTRARTIDRPKFDKRMETSPYYVQQPSLGSYYPPLVLRRGGSWTAPPACLIHHSMFWASYKIELGDVLAQDGVIDGRGVVGRMHGTKNGKDGTLRGYEFKKKRSRGDTGKKWHQAEKERRLALKAEGKSFWPEKEEARPLRPEEVVTLRWSLGRGINVRKYHFRWGGVDFYWKGTATVRDDKTMGVLAGYSHLKLVAVIPQDPGHTEGTKKRKTAEIRLASYTSLVAHRKAGRLEVFDEVVNQFIADHIESGMTQLPEEKEAPESKGMLEKGEGLEEKEIPEKEETYKDIEVSGDAEIVKKEVAEKKEIVEENEVLEQTERVKEQDVREKDRILGVGEMLKERKRSEGEAAPEAASEADKLREKLRTRMRDLIVATVICMLRQEAAKREFVLDMILEAAQNAQ
ncbi:MAG: hypothetical protein M1824_000780 [Vezdaea acicularis]|nr:MAG: hypothetical protein M1824_000780 [Vezdaea acicularis]